MWWIGVFSGNQILTPFYVADDSLLKALLAYVILLVFQEITAQTSSFLSCAAGGSTATTAIMIMIMIMIMLNRNDY